MMPTRPDQALLPIQHAALDAAICQMSGQAPPSPDGTVAGVPAVDLVL
jgi:hypothetical protein